MDLITLLLPLVIATLIILAFFFFNLVNLSFEKLGLSSRQALLLFLATIIGSRINIPISRRTIVYRNPVPFYARFFFYLPPQIARQVIAVNVGGALIPAGFAFYLLPKTPLFETAIATVVVTIVSRLIAKPVEGVGIVMPSWVPPCDWANLLPISKSFTKISS